MQKRQSFESSILSFRVPSSFFHVRIRNRQTESVSARVRVQEVRRTFPRHRVSLFLSPLLLLLLPPLSSLSLSLFSHLLLPAPVEFPIANILIFLRKSRGPPSGSFISISYSPSYSSSLPRLLYSPADASAARYRTSLTVSEKRGVNVSYTLC